MSNELTGRNVGKTCRVHYKGTFNDGKQFDSSYDRGEPLEFVCGAGQMIKGFDAAVADLEVGAEVDIHLLPAEAYGEADPKAIFTMPIAQLPGSENDRWPESLPAEPIRSACSCTGNRKG